MRIAIDARMYGESGIGRYIRNLTGELKKRDTEIEYFILHLKDDYDRLVYVSAKGRKESSAYHNNFRKVLANFKWYGLNEQYQIPKLLNKLKPDLVHFPHFNAPIFYQGKFIVTIHDLIHQHYQMRRASTLDPITYKIKQIGYKTVFKNAISKAQKILVPSNYVKKLLINDWGMDSEKIVVTPEAVDDKIFAAAKITGKEKIERVMKKFNIKKPYIFYVGNAHPHKNVEGLIKVFRELREKYPNLQLVLSGYDHYFWKRVKKENQHEGIIYTGYVDDEELVALYKGAGMFVMPSYEEGFGIPVLEAFACGCPVVSSNAGALPEVGGNAAVYFNPHDMGDMVNKVDKVLNNKNLKNDLIKKGQKRVKLFSWEKLARQTLEVYNQCV